MARRRCGAVAITDRSRRPSSAMPSVRGIGVAVSVSTSTSARSAFIASLWRTPKRCSSSTISRPRRLNLTSPDSSLCVPTMMSMVPSSRPSIAALISLAVRKRDISATFTGHWPKRLLMVWKCCSASSVVGRQQRHLLAAVHGDERGAQRDLGLAEADVAADQAVHRLRG